MLIAPPGHLYFTKLFQFFSIFSIKTKQKKMLEFRIDVSTGFPPAGQQQLGENNKRTNERPVQGGQRRGPVSTVGGGIPRQRHRLAGLAQRLRVQHFRSRQ